MLGLIMDALLLRSLLLSLLEADLGIYNFDNGLTAPAIAVLPDTDHGYNFPPADTDSQGLECLIFQPLKGWVSLLGNGGAVPCRWEIRLQQWDGNQNLLAVANALVPVLARSPELAYCQFSKPVYIPPNREKEILEQVVIRFTETIAVYG